VGGFGSGDWADAVKRKTTVELCRSISARSLKGYGFFAENKTGAITWTNEFGEKTGTAKIQSFVNGNGNKTRLEIAIEGFVTSRQKIELTTTPCHYGGWRWWFVCPVVKDGIYCGNRAGKLYLPPAAEYFGCRECYELTYESCQKSHKYDKVLDHIPENLDLTGLNVNQVLRLACL
jgi:hypothetical protein